MVHHGQQRARGPPPVAALTEDVLVNVFRRLPTRSDRTAASLVCKRWLKVFCDARKTCHLWRAEVVAALIRRCPNLTDIDCSGTIHMEDDGVAALAEAYGAHLTRLELSNNKKVTEQGLRSLGQQCPQLKSLNLTGCTIGDTALMKVAACTGLETLRLKNCRGITDLGISGLAARCKGLRELSLHWCMGISDEALHVLALNCTRLTALDLAFTPVTADAAKAIATAPALKTLVLSGCAQIDDAALLALAQGCPALESLDVSGCELVTQVGLQAVAASHPGLKQISAAVCGQVTDAFLAPLAQNLELAVLKLDHNSITDAGLSGYAQAAGGGVAGEEGGGHGPAPGRWQRAMEELSVPRCDNLGDAGLLAVLPGWRALQRLNLTCCKKVTDAVLKALAASCRDLRALLLEACKNLTTPGLEALVAGCPKLEVLDLTDCQLEERGLMSVVRLQELRTLKLGFCGEVTDAALGALGANCKKLTDLDLYWCSGFGAEGLGHVGRGCPNLQVLNLSYCQEGCSDATLASFCSSARALRNMEMRGCRGVTALGLAAMASGCKALEELDLKKCKGIDDVGLIAISQGCQYLRQINLSYCPVSDEGLKALASLGTMVKFNLVHCHRLSTHGLAQALLRCGGLRKVKLLLSLKLQLPPAVVAELEGRGCFFRWMEKPPDTTEEDGGGIVD